jgi:anaphase-promoting complex subunit 3
MQTSIMPPPLFRNVHAYQNTISGDAPTKQKANGVSQPLRRKYMDEARLKKVRFFHLIAITGCHYL